MRSEAAEKSRSSRLVKSFRVFGAEGVGGARKRREWSLIWPVKLLIGELISGYGIGGLWWRAYGTKIKSCSSASLSKIGVSFNRSSQDFLMIALPDPGIASLKVMMRSNSMCL